MKERGLKFTSPVPKPLETELIVEKIEVLAHFPSFLRFTLFWFVFSFGWIKPAEKSGDTVKTPRLGFSQLKMQAAFTRKNWDSARKNVNKLKVVTLFSP